MHLKTEYKIFGKTIFAMRHQKTIGHPFHFYYHYYRSNSGDFWDIGKYIAHHPNINDEIFALCKNLSAENQSWLLRQIARFKQCHENKTTNFTDLTAQEVREAEKIYTEFLPNILKLNDNLYCYQGYFIPVNHFEANVFFYKHDLEILEKQTLLKMRQKDFIDVGGFVGDSAIIFEKEFCDKNIYSFEPVQQNYERMRQTLKLNESKRIIPVQKGLGAKKEEVLMDVSDRDGVRSSMVFTNKGIFTDSVETIQITTLDDFVQENNIEVGFIKVDIEGAEMQFLEGAKKTICTQKPTMLISIYHQPSDFFHIKPLLESWNLGYRFKIRKRVDTSLIYDTVLFCEILD